MNCAKGMTPWGCGGEQPPSAIRHGLTGDRKALHTTKGQPRRPRAVAQRLRSAGPTHVSDMAPSRSGGVAGRRRALLPSLSKAAGLGHRITFGHPLRLGTAKAIGSWPA